mmetsp:Transcript_26727/g.49055  ORF Transcript_26727/g.49055 Transcript_26727/m.49055 type:complete len:208 (+) Transcript_26727:111-734(+)
MPKGYGGKAKGKSQGIIHSSYSGQRSTHRWHEDSYWPTPSDSTRSQEPQASSKGRSGKGSVRWETPPKSSDVSGNSCDTIDTVNSFMMDERMDQMRKMHTECMKAITSVSDKSAEKFNLIFSILGELQTRQGQLAEEIGSLEAHVSAQQQQQQQQPPLQQSWDQVCTGNMPQFVIMSNPIPAGNVVWVDPSQQQPQQQQQPAQPQSS